MKKSKMFWIGLLTIVLGLIFGVYGNLTTYMDNQGVLHETIYTPLSVLFIIIGILSLSMSTLIYFFRKKNNLSNV